MKTQQIERITAGILRHGNQILLVQQQGKEDPVPSWMFPGGVVEKGETLAEALKREAYEETGLTIERIGNLAYLTQMENPVKGKQAYAFIFEIESWSGTLQTNDPDEFVIKAEFTPLQEAVRRINEVPWRVMREPAAAYLMGEVLPGAAWYYQLEDNNQGHLLHLLKPTH